MFVRVAGAQQLRQLSKDLRKHEDGKEIRAQLRTELRETATPLVPAVRARILAIPSKEQNRRRGRPSLRRQMARTVTLRIRTAGDDSGVTVFVDARKMPPGKRSLPGYFEQVPGKERLRHPTFGRSPWVTQRVPAGGYFTRTVAPAENEVRRRLAGIIDRVANEIENG